VLGWTCVRKGRLTAHKRTMLAAFATSCLFLASYLTYHISTEALTRFPERWPLARGVYLVVLGTHTVLAAVCLPLVLVTLWLALRGRVAKHRRLARWTLPVWLYVSVTGVVVYLMLYQWFPA